MAAAGIKAWRPFGVGRRQQSDGWPGVCHRLLSIDDLGRTWHGANAPFARSYSIAGTDDRAQQDCGSYRDRANPFVAETVSQDVIEALTHKLKTLNEALW